MTLGFATEGVQAPVAGTGMVVEKVFKIYMGVDRSNFFGIVVTRELGLYFLLHSPIIFSFEQGLEISSFLDMKLKLNCQFNSKMVMKLNMNNHHYQLS